MAEQFSTKWIAFQGIAILGSILLAFGIEAWWQSREENEAERVLLAALQLEVQRLTDVIQEDMQFNQAILDSTVKLLHLGSEGGSENLTEKELDHLIGDLFWFNASNGIESGPLVALVDGGEMRLLSNPEIRLELSDLYATLSVTRGFYRNDEDFHHQQFMPFVSEHANVPQLTQSIGRPGDEDFDYGYPKLMLRETRSHRGLLAEQRFQNLLIGKMDRQLDIKNFGHRPLERELANAAEFIAKELND